MGARQVTPAAIPQVGIHRTEDHWYYYDGAGPFPGVTTIIGMYDKSDALIGWAKREVSSFAIRRLADIEKRLHEGEDPERVRKWIASIPDYQRDAAADLGTRVHEAAEELANFGRMAAVSDDVRPYALQYQRFMAETQPDILLVEYMGISLTHRYGGTGDLIVRPRLGRFAGKTTAIDIKTFTKPGPIPTKKGVATYYPTTGMQLAACTRFDFLGREGDPTRMVVPSVDAYAVLYLGSEDYHLIEYKVTGETFEAFLACRRLLEWKHGEGKTIVGAA
jgi:hypothetical protein